MEQLTITITEREERDGKPPLILIERRDGLAVYTEYASDLDRAVTAAHVRIDLWKRAK
jgi:hypothetical protein